MAAKGYEEALKRINVVKKGKKTDLHLDNLELEEIPNDIAKLSDQIGSLYLNGNKIVDISILSSFKKLKVLFLYRNQIENIAPLAALKSLKRLTLGINQVRDISPLSNLRNLNFLRLYKNPIKNLASLATLKNLNELDIHDLNLTDISFLAGLTKLNDLNLGFNNINNISSIIDLKMLDTLNLTNNAITDVSPLTELLNLRDLSLNKNRIIDIFPLVGLKKLTRLDLGNNPIKDFTPLTSLSNLTSLDLKDCGIDDITPLIGLTKLKSLSFENNLITNIPRIFFELNSREYYFSENPNIEGFNFYGNPIKSPPPAIMEAGQNAVLDYFDKLETEGKDQLHEAKLLIVGEGGSGKTTFCRKIQDPNAAMPNDKESTKGIAISPLTFAFNNGKKMRLNIWDFGGQEIYHQTHQFFLTHKSLYVLLTDNRKQDTDFNWWLDTIQAFGGNSPVLIVQNERGDRAVNLNLTEITEMYPQVKQVQAVNFENNRGLADLKKIVELHASKLDHIGEELPKSWVAIRRDLEILSKDKDYISIDEYLSLCIQHGITDRDEALRLCRVYHNLGVLLHFSDNAVLKHTVILRNEWATDAVYKMLDDRPVIDANGRFTRQDCARIWHDSKYKDKHDELLEMMLKFDLCYRMQDSDQYILPQLLLPNKPDYTWDDKDNLQVSYRYEEYMPKGLVNRLMARLNWYADLNRSWKNGTVLIKQSATAEIRDPFGKKAITVRISGNNKRELMLFIDEELNRIHRSYSKIAVKKMLGCTCRQCINNPDKQQYSFDALYKRLKAGKRKVECDQSYEEVDVFELINRVFPTELNGLEVTIEDISTAKIKRKKVFISYSKADKNYRDRLILYLQQFQRNGLIDSWSDKELVAGEHWDERIKTELEQADIILFLCSQDMLETDYIQRVELKCAFEKEKLGEVIVVPIIVKPCTWTRDHQLATNTALPTKGIPIIDKSWGDPDYAYMNIFEGLEKLIMAKAKI